MNISLIIRDLLLRNEQLVIPGFGSFKIIHRPAQISRTSQVLLPPAKEIVFDSQLKSGDNQLLLSIKKKYGLSEAETGEALKKYILQVEEDISSRGLVLMEGLGRIKREANGSLSFEPISELLNPGGVFALPKIDIPVHREKRCYKDGSRNNSCSPEVQEEKKLVDTGNCCPVYRRHHFRKLLHRADYPYSRHTLQKRGSCCERHGSEQDRFRQ